MREVRFQSVHVDGHVVARRSLLDEAEAVAKSVRPAALKKAAAIAVEAAAAWLGLGWALPSGLQTLLAWYGDDRRTPLA